MPQTVSWESFVHMVYVCCFTENKKLLLAFVYKRDNFVYNIYTWLKDIFIVIIVYWYGKLYNMIESIPLDIYIALKKMLY